jgi:hypothetical protein
MAPHLKLVEDLPPEPVPEVKPASKLAESLQTKVKALGSKPPDEVKLLACGILLEEKLKPTKAAEAMRAWFQAYRDGDKVTPLRDIVLGLADEVEDEAVAKPVDFCLGYEPSSSMTPSAPLFSTYWEGIAVLGARVEHPRENLFLKIVEHATMFGLTILGLT